jgi:uncharacterized protein YndB with AHSA1/START domain
MPRPDPWRENFLFPVGRAGNGPSLHRNLQLEERAMPPKPGTSATTPYELKIERLLDAPAEVLFGLWTDPNRMGEWFCPKPWKVTRAELDVRPGGKADITMQGPDGEVMENPGQYLEIIPNRKIVFSDVFIGDWVPKDGAPFMVGTVTFEPEGTKTRYTTTVRHWDAATKEKHAQMGFEEGWGIVAGQLEALAKTIIGRKA